MAFYNRFRDDRTDLSAEFPECNFDILTFARLSFPYTETEDIPACLFVQYLNEEFKCLDLKVRKLFNPTFYTPVIIYKEGVHSCTCTSVIYRFSAPDDSQGHLRPVFTGPDWVSILLEDEIIDEETLPEVVANDTRLLKTVPDPYRGPLIEEYAMKEREFFNRPLRGLLGHIQKIIRY